jgi:YqaJ-like viral recombinase domain
MSFGRGLPRHPMQGDRKQFIVGSDARIIMGKDEKALLRLWREKRGEAAPPDLSGVLIVQLGMITEDLNRRWYELNSGNRISDVQRHAVHCIMPWMAATLDGLVKETGAVFEAKFMLPWSFSEEGAAEKHMAQLQHNMLVAGTKKSVLSKPERPQPIAVGGFDYGGGVAKAPSQVRIEWFNGEASVGILSLWGVLFHFEDDGTILHLGQGIGHLRIETNARDLKSS